MVGGRNFLAENITVRGASHIREEKECQDSSVSWSGDGYTAAIVCDGHGSEKHFRSAIGSSLAAEIGKSAITQFMDAVYTRKHFTSGFTSAINMKNADEHLERLQKSVILRWNEAVLGDVLVSPFCEDERFSTLSERDKNSLERTPAKAYGTTFIAAVFTADFCFVLKLGDGNVNLISSDDILSPDELCDEALSFNCTTSLCMDDADMLFCRYFREISHGNKPCAVILTSDGVINSFPNIAAYHSFIRNIHEAFTEEDGESAKAELEDALINISERGSGDDMSVAIIAPPPETEAL